ncbi:MAG TPA: sigma-70 family RNA polymerase sigma factor [Sedimentisphaerales bacterium]|nr:sigma-70 family RNA polymerase sigma factor [Sedimentisphaerales bacterium]
MLEDKLLVWKLRYGSRDALCRIYEKYRNDLLALAVALSNDKALAEDIVHDVFVSFAELAGKLQLRGNLKSYLAAGIANRVRNLRRSKPQQPVGLDEAAVIASSSDSPQRLAISAEQSQLIGSAMAQLPYQQREVIILHLQAGLKFRAIANSQGVSVNTIQSRYRYGMDKLQSILNGEVKK